MPHADLAAMAAASAPATSAASINPDLIPRNETEVRERKDI